MELEPGVAVRGRRERQRLRALRFDVSRNGAATSSCIGRTRRSTRDEETKSAWVREAREHWGERTWMEEFAREISPIYRRDPRADGLVRLDAARSREPGRRCGVHADADRHRHRRRAPDDQGAHRGRLPVGSRPTRLATWPPAIPNATAVSLPSEGVDPYTDGDQLTDLIDPGGAWEAPTAARSRIRSSRRCCSPISPIRRRWRPSDGRSRVEGRCSRSTMTTSGVSSAPVPRHRGRQRRRRLLLPFRRTCTSDRVREGDRRGGRELEGCRSAPVSTRESASCWARSPPGSRS